MFDVTNNAARKEDQNSLTKTGPVAREEFWRAMKLRTFVAEGIATGETSHKPIRDAEWETSVGSRTHRFQRMRLLDGGRRNRDIGGCSCGAEM